MSVVMRWTAVVQTVAGEGSLCAETRRVLLASCQSASSTMGLTQRCQPERRPDRRRPRGGRGSLAAASRTVAVGSGRAEPGCCQRR